MPRLRSVFDQYLQPEYYAKKEQAALEKEKKKKKKGGPPKPRVPGPPRPRTRQILPVRTGYAIRCLLFVPFWFFLSLFIHVVRVWVLPAGFLASLVACAALNAAVTAAVGAASIFWWKREWAFDLCGMVCFWLMAGLSLWLPVWLRGPYYAAEGGWKGLGVHWRQVVVSGVVWAWAGRIGLYTSLRMLYYRGDSRFDGVRDQPRLFARAFVMQLIWVTVCSLPVVALNSVPLTVIENLGAHSPEGYLGYLMSNFWFWLGIWSVFRGSVLELLADWQLTRWRWERDHGKHNEIFCQRGLWRRSRHPNYYGDWLVWIGITICCSSIVLSPNAQASLGMGPMTALVVSLICPWFLYKMFRHVSIPVIENKYDALYLERKDYRDWRRYNALRFWIDSSHHWFWEFDA